MLLCLSEDPIRFLGFTKRWCALGIEFCCKRLLVTPANRKKNFQENPKSEKCLKAFLYICELGGRLREMEFCPLVSFSWWRPLPTHRQWDLSQFSRQYQNGFNMSLCKHVLLFILALDSYSCQLTELCSKIKGVFYFDTSSWIVLSWFTDTSVLKINKRKSCCI